LIGLLDEAVINDESLDVRAAFLPVSEADRV